MHYGWKKDLKIKIEIKQETMNKKNTSVPLEGIIPENKIIITWWTGRLWKACMKVFKTAIYPTRIDMDITNPEMIEKFLKR